MHYYASARNKLYVMMAKRETLTQLYTVSRSQLGTSPRCLQVAQCGIATFQIIRGKKDCLYA